MGGACRKRSVQCILTATQPTRPGGERGRVFGLLFCRMWTRELLCGWRPAGLSEQGQAWRWLARLPASRVQVSRSPAAADPTLVFTLHWPLCQNQSPVLCQQGLHLCSPEGPGPVGGGPAQDAVGQTAFCPRSLSHGCALTICWAVWEEGKWELKRVCVPVWLLQSHKD